MFHQPATLQIDIEKTYERYGPMVLRRCRRLLRHEEHARDAMHDVFVQLLRSRHRLDDTATSGLLFRIATNVCLNLLRGQRRRPETPDEALLYEIAAADDPAASAGTRQLLGRLFGREPESTRVIAVLHYCDGLTLDEVAAEVGMSVSGVRKRLRRLGAQVPALAAREAS